MNTPPWGSATVTSYAPGVHPFTMARLTKREREEIEREEDEWWWISQERKRAEEEAMWAMWDEWNTSQPCSLCATKDGTRWNIVWT